MLDEQRDEAHERVERVEAVGADQRQAVAGVGERAVTQVDAHLGAEPEETRDQVVRLQDALAVHLRDAERHRFYVGFACTTDAMLASGGPGFRETAMA